MKHRTYLNVPFKENAQAKKLGAWWDPRVRKWYARKAEPKLVQRWGIKKKSTEKILRKKTSNYFNSAKNYPIRIKVWDSKTPKLNIHNAKPVPNSKNEFAKAALCLFVYNKRYYFQKTKKQQLKPLGGSIALQDLNTLDTLYRSLKEEAEVTKNDLTIKSQTYVIHGAVYYLVKSSKKPRGNLLSSFDRSGISNVTNNFTWTANKAIEELAMLSDYL